MAGKKRIILILIHYTYSPLSYPSPTLKHALHKITTYQSSLNKLLHVAYHFSISYVKTPILYVHHSTLPPLILRSMTLGCTT